jgi:hypothetical protein
MADTEGGCQLVDADDRRVAPTLLKAANVLLLAEAATLRQLLLGQTFLLPDPLDVSPDQLAHIHAREMSGYACVDLSTIVCNGTWARTPGALCRRGYPTELRHLEQFGR